MSSSENQRQNSAIFRFYAELKDFLPADSAQRERVYRFTGQPSVKDAFEAQGVPHTEVELVFVNGESVGFDCPLRDGDRVALYPVFESLDVRPLLRVRESPLRRPRFVCDAQRFRASRSARSCGASNYNPTSHRFRAVSIATA